MWTVGPVALITLDVNFSKYSTDIDFAMMGRYRFSHIILTSLYTHKQISSNSFYKGDLSMQKQDSFHTGQNWKLINL